MNLIGKKIKIYKSKCKKPKIGEIVDEMINGEMAKEVFYYIKIEKEKGLFEINGVDLLLGLKQGKIEIYK